MKRILFISDTHCGHKVGWTPPKWQIQSDESWSRVARTVWDMSSSLIRRFRPYDFVIVPGDAIDGKGQKTGATELITADRLEQCEMFADAIEIADCRTIRLVYGCLTAGHKILKSNLTWDSVENLKSGDKIIGFEENANVFWGSRRFLDSEVICNIPFIDDVYDLMFSDGTKVTANGEHKFLMQRGGRQYEWVSVEHLYKISRTSTPGRGQENGQSFYMPLRFKRTIPVWGSNLSYESGYASGFFDGEGTINQGHKNRVRKNGQRSNEHVFRVTAFQKNNIALDFLKECLTNLGFSFSDIEHDKKRAGRSVSINGGRFEQMRFLGTVRPKRLLNNFSPEKIGTIRVGNGDIPLLIDIIPAGKQVCYGLQTTSQTYVSDGFLSHNTAFHTGTDEDMEQHAVTILKERGYDASIKGHGFYNIEGVNVNVKHHISGSSIHHGVATPLLREIDANRWWYMEGVEPKADLLVRGHTHSATIVQHDQCWGIIMPALQGLGSKYARRLNKVVHVGVVVVEIDNGRVRNIEPLYVPGHTQASSVETL